MSESHSSLLHRVRSSEAPELRRVIYISRSLTGDDADTLASILASSAARNGVCGVTGMLWWSDDTFAQVLEGDSDAVGETMQRIGRDPRHTMIEIVEDRAVSGRLFGQWGMVRADDGPEGIAGTAYLVGLCSRSRAGSARRLCDFLVEHA